MKLSSKMSLISAVIAAVSISSVARIGLAASNASLESVASQVKQTVEATPANKVNNIYAYAGEALAKNAKVSLSEARKIALQAHPGTIVDEELENEGGGSGLRYSFDVKQGAKTYEVGVDAKTGQVLENAAEGKNPD